MMTFERLLELAQLGLFAVAGGVAKQCHRMLKGNVILPFYTFYGVWKWSDTHAVVVQLGNKFDLQDNFKAYPSEQEYKYFKGFTTEISFYKDIS